MLHYKKKSHKVEKWTERIFKPDVATEHHEKKKKIKNMVISNKYI